MSGHQEDAVSWGTTRTEAELAGRQVEAIEAFHAARRAQEQRTAAEALSREEQLDVAREVAALDRAREALVARTHIHLLGAGKEVFRASVPRRAVVAHRNDWFGGRVEQALRDVGIHVVARVDNGADALGVAVAEQPDVILVEESLAMMPGPRLVRAIRRLSPWTVVAAQVADSGRAKTMLDAGAATVFTRQVPPAEGAASLVKLVPRRPRP